MRNILIDTIPFQISPKLIRESEEKNNGRVIVSGVLQRAGAKNQNGRIYPKEILMREASRYAKTEIVERRALGELDHPDSSVVNLQNASHNINKISWKGDYLMGEVEVLGTPSGNILKELLKANIKLSEHILKENTMKKTEELEELHDLINLIIDEISVISRSQEQILWEVQKG